MSQARTTAFAKYLVTLSKSFCPRDLEVRIDTTRPGDENEGLGKIVNGKVQQLPEPAFKRLHILYLVHDILSYIHNHLEVPGHSVRYYPKETLEQVRPDVCTLAELVVCGCGDKAAKTTSAVMNLLAYWRDNQFFTSEQVDSIRHKVLLADETEWDRMLERLTKVEESKAVNQEKRRDDGVKWIVPYQHGVIDDPSAPWHELPAANGLYMKRTRGYPLRASTFPAGGVYLRNGGQCS